MPYKISTSGTSPDHIRAYSQLLSTVFNNTSKFSSQYLHWLYAQNPLGTVVGTDAFFEGQLMAHHATIPVSYFVDGKLYKGLLALNNATLPGHQGKGLLKQLAVATFEEGQKQGYDFIITVTNQNSTHAYLTKFGFRLLSPLDVKIGFGRINVRSREDYPVHSNWNEKSLNWRLSNPSTTYFTNNQLLFSATHLPLVSAQLSAMKFPSKAIHTKRKTNIITLWIGLAANKKVKGLFVDLPHKFKPSPLNLLFKDLSGRIPMFSKNDVSFELLDFDAY